MWGLPARLEVKAIMLPFGLQAGLVSMAGELVRRRRLPPERSQVKISMLPSRDRAKAIWLPSGENVGLMLSEPEVTSGRLRPAARSAREIHGAALTHAGEAMASPVGLQAGDIEVDRWLVIRRWLWPS